jgi:putative ABC transport system permease protein
MEFATCLALGANRGRLVRGVVIEGGILALVGALLSVPGAVSFLAALRSSELPGHIRVEALNLSIAGSGAIAAIGGATFATLVIAVIAGLFGVSASRMDELRPGSGSTRPLKRRVTQPLLLIGQVAVSLVLLGGATLFARSLTESLRVNPGFDTRHLITGTVSVSAYRFTPEQAVPYFTQLRERLAAAATVKSVSLPLSGGGMGGFLRIDGIERHFPSAIWEDVVDENYFPTIGLPILKGRNFTAVDDSRAPLVTIVSESFGRMIANGGNPVGSRITSFHGNRDGHFPDLTIVGVVPDVITNVAQLQPLAMYTPVAQLRSPPTWTRTLFARPGSDVETTKLDITAIARNLDPSMKPAPIVSIITMDEQIGRQMGPQRLGSLVLGWLGGTALFLTLLGAYVLAESMTVARRREMGLRAALGATKSQLGGLVFAETIRLVGIGIGVGLLLAWLGAATVRALLFKVSPMDPFALAGSAVLILVLTIVVCVRPARAAANVDVASLLREQ